MPIIQDSLQNAAASSSGSAAKEAAPALEDLRARRDELAAEIEDAGICRCPSKVWYGCSAAPCDTDDFRARVTAYLTPGVREAAGAGF